MDPYPMPCRGPGRFWDLLLRTFISEADSSSLYAIISLLPYYASPLS